jgi:hypothetical protein
MSGEHKRQLHNPQPMTGRSIDSGPPRQGKVIGTKRYKYRGKQTPKELTPLQTAVLEELRGIGGRTGYTLVAKNIGRKPGSVRNALFSLRERGLAERDGAVWWSM